MAEHLHEFQQATRRLAGALEECKAGLVGCRLLRPAVGQQVALGDLLTALHDGHAGIRTARRDGRGSPEHQRKDGGRRGVAQRILRARQMAAGDVAGFVRDHADDLSGVLGAHDQAGIDEQVLSASNEGIQRTVMHQKDVDGLRRQAGGVEQWRAIGPDGIFDLRVADEAGGLPLRRRRGGHERHQNQSRGLQGKLSQGFRQGRSPAPRPGHDAGR